MISRKLRKMIRHPRAFFLDSRIVQAIRRLMKLSFPLTKIGKNWRGGTAPVAIMLGFLPWKRKFVAEYLYEFRTLFAETNVPIETYADKILTYHPLCIIIWGYNERYDVTAFAVKHDILVYRMEDGFLRSAALGSAHGRPYSLVLDKSSLYFNAEEQSDLEKLLSTYDFNQSQGLLQRVEQLISFQREFGISKYNLPAVNGNDFKNQVEQKRCILVVGQVEDDKSIIYGRGSQWTCARLIQLACDENPDCEILYKPHPDIVYGMRTGNAPLGKLPPQCKIVERDISLDELFKLVERVYVITSLAGFEALIHGLPVTTVGIPFYAGWGLTDDRNPALQRNRNLTLTEVYTAAYLLYPRYILDLQNKLEGCRKTLLKLCEEKYGVELLGSNWENMSKPVALLYGVSRKVGQFLAESLIQYRVARLRQKDENIILHICHSMKVQTIFTTTITFTDSIIRHAEQKHIDLVVISKGFDCLGTNPSVGSPGTLALTPLSGESPRIFGHHVNRLISILSEFPVAEHADQIASMKLLLPLNRLIIRSLNILGTKNSPLQSIIPGICPRVRILILAKSNDEAASLIKLARQDHSDGAFFIILENIESVADTPVFSPDARLLPSSALQQSLDFVDYVYTHDSLYGIEALRYNIPVVVSGRPFYAGWGFTKDIHPIKRPRQLRLEEFFYAVFALYPRYVCSPQDSLIGFFCTSLKLGAKQLDCVIRRESFGISVEKNKTVEAAKDIKYRTLLQNLEKLCHESGWHMVIICLLWGFGKKGVQKQILRWAEKHLPVNMLPNLLQILMQTGMMEDGNREKSVCSPAIEIQLSRIHSAFHDARQSRQNYLLTLARGNVTLETLEEFSEILTKCMDFESAAALSRLLYSLTHKARYLTNIVVARACSGNLIEAMIWLALLSGRDINEAIRASDIIQTAWVHQYPGINIYACIRSWANDEGSLEKRVKLRMFASEFDDAIQLMDSNDQEVSDSLQLSQLYARIKFFLGEYDEAEYSYTFIMRKFGLSPSICYNYLYFCMHAGRYANLEEMLNRCGRMNIPNKAFLRACLKLNQRNIRGNFPALCDLDSHNQMRRLLGEQCVRSLDDVHEGEHLLVIACSGLGDEISDAIFYQRIVERCSGRITFTCDPRLYNLFLRSLPDIDFEPVRRLRYITDLASFSDEYTDLPSSDFIFMFDNRGYELSKRADKVILAIDAVRSVVGGYKDLSGLAHMKANDQLVRYYRGQLPDDGKLNIGLCWRSAIKRYSRARNYCTIEDFAPLLQRSDVRFVLLQYDGCTSQESIWLDKNFPGKTISFEGLDMFNDLDGLAAAISSLDLVISPPVNIRQFSGSMNIPTSFLVSGASLDWRKAEYDDHDLIYSGTVHRRIDDPDNLIARLQQDINEALERKVLKRSHIS